jgi:phenylalanyl-tRNA synthetase beta chain
MGGAETEISFQTKNVLLESAWFDPVTTRRMAFALGMRTEASYRFERGMNLEAPVWAARRCAELILELAGGELLAGAIDAYPRQWESPVVPLRQSEIERILGEPVVPSWRRDVSREVDVIEEVARHYGYAKFPARLPPTRRPVVPQPHARCEAVLRSNLEAQGYDEAVTFSLVNPAETESFSPPGSSQVAIQNPLSEEAAVLRPSGLLSLVKALAYNVNRGQRNLSFYEMGRAYSLREKKFSERRILTLAASGLLQEKSVQASEQPFDLFALKGTIEAALEPFQLAPLEFRPSDAACFHPAQRAGVFASDQPLGVLGQLHPNLAARFKLRQEAYLAELDLEALYAAGLRPRRYQPLSRFPAVARRRSPAG